ncbi:hypothetical protein GOODEAATRI_007766 [Goodea atripinnis]|uniref:Uncharacterized protein n=1 Tax=Goodea atripinnis TaxID=208336 RepID=A0ABV0NV51_9TELE
MLVTMANYFTEGEFPGYNYFSGEPQLVTGEDKYCLESDSRQGFLLTSFIHNGKEGKTLNNKAPRILTCLIN